MLGWRSSKELSALELLRRLRSDNQPLRFGKSPVLPFTGHLSIYTLPVVLGILTAVSYVLLKQSAWDGFWVGVSIWGVFVVPGLLFLLSQLLISYRERVEAQMTFFESIRSVLFFVVIFLISVSYLGKTIYEHFPKDWQTKKIADWLFYSCIGLGITGQVIWHKLNFSHTPQYHIKLPKRRIKLVSQRPFSLWLGQSSGELAENRHGVGLAPGCNINLSLTDAAQNILILGGIGSGKTTRAMHPLLMQLLDQECGGLIFNVKRDFQAAVQQFSENTQRTVTTIGIGQQPFNLLAGLSPEIAASFLKSAFLLSNAQRLDTFWVDTATELCRNALGVLSHFPELYSLQNLYQFLFIEKFREHIKAVAMRWLEEVDSKEAALLQSYLNYDEHIFSQFEAKVKSNVLATVAQVLAPFNHPKLIEAFCTASAQNEVRLEAVLDGAVYLVDLPLAQWGLGAKVAYTLIKLRFFNVMQQRALHKDWNQTRPIFFMCDEYQELISASNDGLSDLNFWDKSRSSKTIGIISAQSVSSFYATLQNRDMAQALLQNFRQKLCFRTEDAATIHLFKELMGYVDMPKVTTGQTHGTSGWPFGEPHESSQASTSWHKEAVLDAQTFRTLLQHQAVALLSINGHAWDDVLNMLAVYV